MYLTKVLYEVVCLYCLYYHSTQIKQNNKYVPEKKINGEVTEDHNSIFHNCD
jgi:hypothetical protein